LRAPNSGQPQTFPANAIKKSKGEETNPCLKI
jgi:hypothetical protein